MLSTKLIFVLAIAGSYLSGTNGQFGFNGPFGNPFGGVSGSQAGFSNQNTNFQQQRGGAFGVVAGFGTSGSNTNFNQQTSSGGNYGHQFVFQLIFFPISFFRIHRDND